MYQNYITQHLSPFTSRANVPSNPSIPPVGFMRVVAQPVISSDVVSFLFSPPANDDLPSGYVHLVELQDTGNCVCTNKINVNFSTGNMTFVFIRFESDTQLNVGDAVSLTDADIDIFPYSGVVDYITVDSTPRTTGNFVYFGIGLIANNWTQLYNRALYAVSSLDQHIKHVPFNQPQK